MIPNLQELTESFSNFVPNYITSINLSSGFFQMGISPESTRYTAFNTCFGTYKFLRLPMGLSTSPSSFQLLMDKVLHGLTFQSCLCYLDDVLICSETFEQHIDDLQIVFDRFRLAGLKLRPKKCSFAQSSCVFLGHLISKDGISPPPDRVDAIQNYPAPKNVKEFRRLIGMLNWFRKFIPNFSSKILPLTRLLKKNQLYIWSKEQEIAFTDLKRSLIDSKILAFPNYDLPFRLAVDTSSRGIGYMLYQMHSKEDCEDIPRVIRFGSKSLSKWQQSYGPTKLELLGMVVSILDCADYLRGSRFIVECDHQALKPIFQKQFKGAIYERWLAILQQFNFELHYKPAEQMQVPDALSRCHWENPQQKCEQVVSPDEDDPFFPYVSEMTGQIKLPSGKNLANFLKQSDSDETLNINCVQLSSQEPEYDADTDEIDSATLRKKKSKSKISSSKLQSQCENDENISDSVYEQTTDVPNRANVFDYSTVSDRQSQNFEKDTDINTRYTENDSPNIKNDDNISLSDVELFQQCDFTPENIRDLQRRDNELIPIINFLKNNTLPDLQKDARKLLLQATDYLLVNDILFHSSVKKSKRKHTLRHYQLVVPKLLIKFILQICHDSPMGGHAGIQNTTDRVREHYFFPRLSTVVSEYVRSCHECQIRKTSSLHTKAGIVAYPTPTEPFQVWEVDLCGPFPLSSAGHSYIFTAIDMFSKLVFAVPLNNCDHLSVSHALYQLFTQYGVCHTLISDQGSEFISRCTKQLCKLFDVKQEFTSLFRGV